MRGDINDDGFVNIADSVYLLLAIFVPGSMMPDCNDTADTNDDGAGNVCDTIFLLNTLFVPGSPPIPPPLVCGEDPTADAIDCVSFAGCP